MSIVPFKNSFSLISTTVSSTQFCLCLVCGHLLHFNPLIFDIRFRATLERANRENDLKVERAMTALKNKPQSLFDVIPSLSLQLSTFQSLLMLYSCKFLSEITGCIYLSLFSVILRLTLTSFSCLDHSAVTLRVGPLCEAPKLMRERRPSLSQIRSDLRSIQGDLYHFP